MLASGLAGVMGSRDAHWIPSSSAKSSPNSLQDERWHQAVWRLLDGQVQEQASRVAKCSHMHSPCAGLALRHYGPERGQVRGAFSLMADLMCGLTCLRPVLSCFMDGDACQLSGCSTRLRIWLIHPFRQCGTAAGGGPHCSGSGLLYQDREISRAWLTTGRCLSPCAVTRTPKAFLTYP